MGYLMTLLQQPDYAASYDWMGELKGIWKEAVIA
jgi:hypothetical protein